MAFGLTSFFFWYSRCWLLFMGGVYFSHFPPPTKLSKLSHFIFCSFCLEYGPAHKSV